MFPNHSMNSIKGYISFHFNMFNFPYVNGSKTYYKLLNYRSSPYFKPNLRLLTINSVSMYFQFDCY